MLSDDNRLQIGDIVYLKSGSPKLRVVETNRVTVEWTNDQKEIERSTFSEVCLSRFA
jgi:uncharacterized protein YodC (DUF2158 family)